MQEFFSLKILELLIFVYFTQVFRESVDVYASYSESGSMITLQEFQSFLIQEQRDQLGNDEREVSRFMREYLQDSQRNVQEPFFTTVEVN